MLLSDRAKDARHLCYITNKGRLVATHNDEPLRQLARKCLILNCVISVVYIFLRTYTACPQPACTRNFQWRFSPPRRLYIRSSWRTRPPGSYHAQGRKRLAHRGCQSRLSAFGFLCELQTVEVRRKSPEWAGAICRSTFYRKIHGWHFAFDTDTAARTWISKRDRTKVSPTTSFDRPL